jgi:hypothetical protein
MGEDRVRERAGAKAARTNLEFGGESTYLEDLPRGTTMDPQGLVQRVVERGPMVSKLLPQRLLSLGLVEVGRWRTGTLPLHGA